MNQILANVSPASIALPGVEVALPLVSRIYLGAAIPKGGWVGQDEFQAFLNTIVAEQFPDGFSVSTVEGAWRDTETGDLIREVTRVVEVAHDYDALGRIRYVAGVYKATFDQQAVMVSTTQAAVSFV